jgi:hypothetical protein
MTKLQTKALQELANQSNYEISIQESEISKLWHAALNVTNLWSENKKNSILKFIDSTAPFSNEKIPLKSYNISSYIGIKVMRTRYLLTRTLLSPFAIILQILSPTNFLNSGNLLLSRSKNFKASDENNARILDGQMIQKLWLKATALGLVMHPNHTSFNSTKGNINSIFKKLLNIDSEKTVFIARIGEPRKRNVYSRSTRTNKLK